MKAEILLREQRNVEFAIDQIKSVDLSELHVVKIAPFKRTRSQAQNNLYWKWITVICNHVGMTEDDLHMELKAKHVLPVLLANGDEETTEINEAVRVIWHSELKEQAKIAKRNMIRHTVSTTKLNVQQFSDYLRKVEEYAHDGNIALPYPEEYHQAMGIKQ